MSVDTKVSEDPQIFVLPASWWLSAAETDTSNGKISINDLYRKADTTTNINLDANHTTPADAQIISNINFLDDSSTAVERTYAQIRGIIQDPTNTLEEGELILSAIDAGTLTDYLILNEAGDGQVNLKVDLDLQSNNLEMGDDGEINFGVGEQLRMVTNDMLIDVTAGNFISYFIGGVGKFIVRTDEVSIKNNDIVEVQNLVLDLSTSGTDIDFDEDELQEISIAANTTFTGVNYAIGKKKTVKITTDATLRTLAFPPTWTFVGSAAPANQAASKEGLLTLTSYTALESGVIASYVVEP